jgi:hypothetical protein
MSESDTPRTDEQCDLIQQLGMIPTGMFVARTLERELVAMTKQRDELLVVCREAAFHLYNTYDASRITAIAKDALKIVEESK